MTVHIRYLSVVREKTNRRSDEVILPERSTIADAADWVKRTHELKLPSPHLIMILNGRGWTQLPGAMATLLHEGDIIAIFPLVSGG